MSTKQNGSRPWTAAECIAFRFAAIFIFLQIFPFPLSYVPGLHVLAQWYMRARQALVIWIGDRILQLPEPITVFQSGSGDKTFDFVALLAATVLAVAVTIGWTLPDRGRTGYDRMMYWLRVGVRYYLGMMMVIYGISKVFHLQMPSPSLYQLVQPFGDKSPMGLAWSYVGYSKAFSMFTGLVEVTGGLLLFFRRTTLLGALLVAAIMLNVAMMNFCFDIPVKLFSMLLFLLCLFLIAPDSMRLMQLFVWNRPTQPVRETRYVPSKRWVRILAVATKAVFILTILAGNVNSTVTGMKKYGDKRPKSALYGLYDTELFVLAGDTLPPLTTDRVRWRQLIMDKPDYAHLKAMNDSITHLSAAVDTATRSLTLRGGQHRQDIRLQYSVSSDTLHLRGLLNSDSVTILLRKRNLQTFRLIGTEFRWIQEYPFNR